MDSELKLQALTFCQKLQGTHHLHFLVFKPGTTEPFVAKMPKWKILMNEQCICAFLSTTRRTQKWQISSW